MKRNKRMFNKWIKALRSGEYAQGKDYLVTTRTGEDYDRFCCLGVLNDVNGRGVWKPKEGRRFCGSDYEPFVITYYHQGNNPYQLSDKARRELGITLREQSYLMELNDRGATFNDIADVLEEMVDNVPGYKGDYDDFPEHLLD